MAVNTIPQDLTADDITKLVFAKRKRVGASADLEDDTKYAVVLLELHTDVVQPDDYAELRTNIVGIQGIQDATLIVDHQTSASVPENHTQVMQAFVNITLRDDTP